MTKPTQTQPTLWQFFMLILCVHVLIALLVETFFVLPAQAAALLIIIDTLVCLVFISDFVYNLVTAPSKRGYLYKCRLGFEDQDPSALVRSCCHSILQA